MKIIFVAAPQAAPTAWDFKCWRMRARFGIAVSGAVLFCAAAGFAAALVFANPRDRTVHEVRAMRATIAEQQKALDGLETTSRRNLDALALQLGALQAQATRLNALGQRLAQVGKLEDGEFNFEQAPGMGGAEDPGAVSHPLNFNLADNIAGLRNQFSQEDIQLSVLETVLLDRRVDNALLPSGYPVVSGYIGSGFGSRTDPINGFSEYHTGLDFDAAPGSDITSVAEGVVVWNGERAGYGNVVEVDHGNGYMTRYAHNQKNLVQVGERVHAGQVIAKVGSTGRATGPHCHFEVWLHGRPVNPMAYVNGVARKA